MEPEARYTLIGAVVLALVAAAIGGFLWLNSSGRGSDFRFYTVYFEHQSLDGLQVGSAVNMRGIMVGRVERYSIEPDNINRVRVLLRVERQTPVRQNTKASITRNIVTGIARVRLVTPSPPGPELTRAPPGERYPVIAEAVGHRPDHRFGHATGGVGRNRVDARQPADRAENQQVFGELLVSLRDLARGLDARLSTLDRTPPAWTAAWSRSARRPTAFR